VIYRQQDVRTKKPRTCGNDNHDHHMNALHPHPRPQSSHFHETNIKNGNGNDHTTSREPQGRTHQSYF
jgi:hypothetical protein